MRALKESDAYPAMAERGYGWEKLMSEMFCQEYWAERGMKTAIARFHNVYGPNGTWDGGREKAPAAICRKVIEAKDTGRRLDRNLGRRHARPAASCTSTTARTGIDMITHCEELIATPINLGSSELVSVDELVSIVEEIAGVKLRRSYKLDAPKGVAGRNSDNTMIQRHPALGAQHALARRAGKDLRLDREAIPGPQGGQADRVVSGSHIADVIGAIPYRMAFAGGWIDQPFVSRHNPSPPGSMVVVGLEPTFRFMDRAGMATGTRKVAMELWNGRLPKRDPAELVRELYAAENRGKSEPSGSQDMIGLIYPGVNRLDFDFVTQGGIFPEHIESNNDPAIARWLEEVIHMVPVDAAARRLQSAGREEPRPGVDSGGWARPARTATMRSCSATRRPWARR